MFSVNVEQFIEWIIILILSFGMSLGAKYLGMLTDKGTVASIVTGCIVGFFGGLYWLILMTTFTVAGLVATKISFEKKKAKGLQEGKNGERTHMNILGVGLPPALVSILAFFVDGYHDEMTVFFIGTLAVAAADTLASEIGTKDERVWLITNFKRTVPGVNGGVSVLGTVVSLVGALAISILGWLMIYGCVSVTIIIPTIAGMVGNILDSVFGATIEDGGYISKYTNNCLTGFIGGSVGMLLFMLL